MPTYPTPEPIAVTIDLPVGDVRIVASDRDDTVVHVRPGDDGDRSGVDAIRVDYDSGQLTVRATRGSGWGAGWGLSLFSIGWHGSVDVEIAVPTGSRVESATTYGGFRGEGRLGECRVRADYGDIRLEHAGPVDLRTGGGTVAVDRVDGHAEITNGAGGIRVGEIDGSALLRSDHDEIRVGEITGDLRMSGANADMRVDRALADVEARNAYGGVRLGEVVRGTVALTTTYGQLEIGVRDGTAAWLDVSSTRGRLHTTLGERDDPAGFGETVEIHARTRDGDVVVRRA